MRIALIVVLGFCAVFVWTLIAAQGNESPSLRATHFCGTWRPHGKSPGRHVVYARDMSCPRARMVAADYSRTRTCPVTSMSFTKGTAGRRLIWIGCEHPEGKPPRAVFSVDRVR
jgi:hypothetical protein